VLTDDQLRRLLQSCDGRDSPPGGIWRSSGCSSTPEFASRRRRGSHRVEDFGFPAVDSDGFAGGGVAALVDSDDTVGGEQVGAGGHRPRSVPNG